MNDWLHQFGRRLRFLFRRKKSDRELDEEMRLHRELREQELSEHGFVPEEAHYAAQRQFGNPLSLREESREMWGWNWLEHAAQDLRYGLRMLRKNPGFTAVAVLTLALGIGANTAIFSLTDQVLLRLLPVENPEQLVVLRSPGPNPGHTWSDGDDSTSFSYPMYRDLRDKNQVFAGLAACRPLTVNVAGQGGTERAEADLVSGNFFEVLGVRPALGRVFTSQDETSPGANPVAVLSYGYWTRRLGNDPGILNKQIIVNGTGLTVVGVARAGFDGVQIGWMPDVYLPITMKAQMTPGWNGLEDRKDHWVPVLGRIKPGLAREKAEAAIQVTYQPILQFEVASLHMTDKTRAQFLGKKLLLDPGSRGRPILQRDAQEPLLFLMAMVGLVLLIACANLASLLVARGEARQREIAVRLAMGAGRLRLFKQFLTESLLIALAGGLAGLLVAWWCLGGLIHALTVSAGAQGLHTQLDPRVLLFSLALSLFTGLLFGLAPAMRSTRADLHATLKEQGASVSSGTASVRMRKILIVSQMALTGVLLVGAGLFATSLGNLRHANLGLRPDHVIQFSVTPRLSGYSPAQTVAFVDRLRQTIAALPGVRAVGFAEIPVFQNDDSSGNVTVEGYTAAPDEDMDVMRNRVGPNYFSTMGIPLIAGREFSASDAGTSPKVGIINEKMARRFFAGRNPIGLHVGQGSGSSVHLDIEIVGVVEDSKHDDARDPVRPFLYQPYAQETASVINTAGQATFYVRTEQRPDSLAATLRQLVQSLDADLPVYDLKTLAQQVDDSMIAERLLSILSVSLGVLASLLAAVGLYGVMAYRVARRTQEIGIRMALGATRKSVAWMVLGEVVRLTALGLAIGLPAAYGLGKLVESQLFGVKASNPLVFILGTTLLAAVALLAGWLPARRATKVDPIVALRYE